MALEHTDYEEIFGHLKRKSLGKPGRATKKRTLFFAASLSYLNISDNCFVLSIGQ